MLSFGKGEKKNLRGRVGPDGHNPLLNEIEDRLRNPEARKATLEKSIITRIDPEFIQKVTKRPTVRQDKTMKIATKDIYDSIRVKNTIPDVPIHRMDEI